MKSWARCDTGACADIAVLRKREGKFGFMDCGGARLNGSSRLECVATLRAGGKRSSTPKPRACPNGTTRRKLTGTPPA